MTQKQYLRLARWKARLNEQEAKYRVAVRKASKDRAHYQGCRIGGLWATGSSDISGQYPCWCGDGAVETASFPGPQAMEPTS